MRSRSTRAAALFAPLCLIVACSHVDAGIPEADTPPDDPYARAQYSTVWTAPSGLDLLSPEGTFLRASIESLDVSAVNGRKDAAVPGFWDALSGPATAAAAEFFELGPALPEYGIKRYEVLQHAENGDRLTATVCAHSQQVGHRSGDRYEFAIPGPRAQVVSVDRSGPTRPTINQRGRQPRADSATVFGSWRLTSWERGHFPDGDPCAGRPLPGVAADSWPQSNSGKLIISEPPTAANIPGWPGGIGS